MHRIWKVIHIADISFFVILLTLLSLSDVLRYVIAGLYRYAVLLFLFYYLCSWLICKLIGLINIHWIVNGIKFVILFVVAMQLSIDLFCLTTDIPFNYHIAELIFATNPNEILEFFRFYVPAWLVLTIIICLILLFCIYKLCQKSGSYSPIMAKIEGGVFLLSCVACLHYTGLWQDSVVARLMLYSQVDYPRDLRECLIHPNLSIRNSACMPHDIIVVMGESYARGHSSLYGYRLNTCPYLSALHDNGSLVVYNNVSSAELITSQSFKCMMSSYKPEFGNNPHWYECVTIPEVFNLSGYTTVWISNQIKTGIIDNVVGRYAELCDTSIFINPNFVEKQEYDGKLVPIIRKEIVRQKDKPCLWIIHLMGSHDVFKERYPQTFLRFTEADYYSIPDYQRTMMAEYDNSVAYNDSIVSDILHLFDRNDAVAFYLSDHGLDIYDSDNKYIGHGRAGNKISEAVGRDIPFMIYQTPLFLQQHLEQVEKIRKNRMKSFRTDNLIYTLMDVAGIDFKDNNDVTRYSLFNE